jgi:hypothetical protein
MEGVTASPPVMAGLDPAIHVFQIPGLAALARGWN